MLADPLRSDELGDNELAGPPFAAVLRLSDVAVPQCELETALGVTLDRYEPARTGPLYYAQVDIDITAGSDNRFHEDDFWAGIIDCIERLGPEIQTLRSDRRIERIFNRSGGLIWRGPSGSHLHFAKPRSGSRRSSRDRP